MAPIILCDTAGMSNDRWLECRAHGPDGSISYTIGGSDVAVIFGLSPWVTPLELWMRKKGRYSPPPPSNPHQLQMGHDMEPIVAAWYARLTGNVVIQDTNLYQHSDHPYALANIDRRFIRKTDGALGILECKTCSFYKREDWADDAYPIYYELQIRFYQAVLELNLGQFACMWGMNPDTDFAAPIVERSTEKEDMIFQGADEFIWSLDHDRPPKMDGSVPTKNALAALAKVYGDSLPFLPTISLPAYLSKHVLSMLTEQEHAKALKERLRECENRFEQHSVFVADVMKAHEHAILESGTDKILIDFVTKSRTGVDTKRLKQENPALYQQYAKTTKSRSMKVQRAT